MRRQVNWLVLAATSLAVIAFVVPLTLLVRRQAEDRAQVAAEQRAQAGAAALAVAVSSLGGSVGPDVAERALVADIEIVLSDGTRVGDIGAGTEVVATALSGRPASTFTPAGDWQVALPVATPAGMVAVVAVAEAAELSAGVWRATGLLAGLALAVVAGSVLLADRLGRSLVIPVRDLATVADRLADGDLEARAEVEGPSELRAVASALNGLAGRLRGIIEGEREALADLSHRLRTPLTALRLHAEMIEEKDRGAVLAQVDRTQSAVDQLINDVRDRGRSSSPPAATDLVETVRHRFAFWEILAANQGRAAELRLAVDSLTVPAPRSEVAAAVDALVGNVFAHTEPGTGFAVSVRRDGETPIVEVSDDGPGFGTGRAVERGASGSGSTGLGLDIARRLGENLGGSLTTDDGPVGGAIVTVRLGP